MTKYTFSVMSDFPQRLLSSSRLSQEIRASGIATALDYIATLGDACEVWFKSPLSVGDESTLADLVAAHTGVPLVTIPEFTITGPKTAGNNLIVAVDKLDVSRGTFVTHDWADPTTWFGDAIRVVDEAPSTSDNRTFRLAHQNAIDTFHGHIFQEDFLLSAGGHSLRMGVKVNDQTKQEQDPHVGSGGDFTVDYAVGQVVFLSALTYSDAVRVTYHYANGSEWVLKPAIGKKLKVSRVECQFADDWVMTDSVVFQPYGLVDVFAPQLVGNGQGQIPAGTKIPLGNPAVYKSANDFQNEANLSFPMYPAIGGLGWRGAGRACLIMNWDYVSATVLRSDWGMEIRIKLQHDVPFGGWFATATLYCTSEPLT